MPVTDPGDGFRQSNRGCSVVGIKARLERLEEAAKLSAPRTATQGDRLTRVEVKLEADLDSLSEIKTILRATTTAKPR